MSTTIHPQYSDFATDTTIPGRHANPEARHVGEALRRRLDEQPVARLSLENNRPITLPELLARVGHASGDDIIKSIDLLAAAESVALPVVGITGMMNTGKSTVTSHLLSKSGRARVLAGIKPEDGTHRFVLWAPASWSQDPEKRKALDAMLVKVFGEPLEELSTDPEQAFAQYNAREDRERQLEIPLLAFDPALDAHGMAVLDCPDIQREHAKDTEAGGKRQDLLAKACRMCSAFLVVSSHEQFEADTLRRVIECIGGAQSHLPLFAVVTKVEAKDMGGIAQEIESRLRGTKILDRVRAAYVDPRVADPSAGGPDRYRAVRGGPEDIHQVCHHLDQTDLQREYVADARKTVLQGLKAVRKALAARQAANREATVKARKTVLNFLDHHFNGREKGLRPIYEQDLVGSILESISRTAPFYARPSLYAAGILKGAIQAIAQGGAKLLELVQTMRGKLPDQGAKLDNMKHVRAENLVQSLRDRDWMPARATDDSITEVWEQSMQLMAQGGFVDQGTLDAELDEVMRKVWEEVPMWRKLTFSFTGPVVLAAGLVSVMVLPPVAGPVLLLEASLVELLAALGLGLITTPAAGAKLNEVVEQHAARPQLSALFAYLQDHLGLPRANDEELEAMKENKGLRLTASPKVSRSAIMGILADPVFELNESALDALEEPLRGAGG